MFKLKITHCALSFFIFATDAFNKIKRHMVINNIHIRIQMMKIKGQ